MARPKGKLFALLAVFIAIALVAATGAFTSVEAERTVSVNVSDDSDALLQLEANGSSPNGAYATTDGGQLVIDLDNPSGVDGAGLNDNATTEIFHIVNVTNQGTQSVGLSADVSNSNSDVKVTLVGNHSTPTQDVNLTGSGTINGLDTGETASLGLVIVTDDAGSSANFNETVTLTADEADA
ncbi:MAG: hypothetical protein ABEH88_07435 [Halobacteriales archaeon]